MKVIAEKKKIKPKNNYSKLRSQKIAYKIG